MNELVWTIFSAPAECWCTEMEQISSPFKHFTASPEPLVAGATNKPGEWQLDPYYFNIYWWKNHYLYSY